jgi:ferredoxin
MRRHLDLPHLIVYSFFVLFLLSTPTLSFSAFLSGGVSTLHNTGFALGSKQQWNHDRSSVSKKASSVFATSSYRNSLRASSGSSGRSRSSKLFAAANPHSTHVGTEGSPVPGEGLIAVRFKNVPDSTTGEDVVVYAKQGTNVLRLGEKNGVKIPRSCRQGLCGTCTADLVDPSWVEPNGKPSIREGYQAIRTCCAGVMLPAGCEEMEIDLFRNSGGSSDDDGLYKNDAGKAINPMKRFDDNWESEFKANWVDDKSSKKVNWATKKKPGDASTYSSAEKQQPGIRKAPWDRVWDDDFDDNQQNCELFKIMRAELSCCNRFAYLFSIVEMQYIL